MYIILLIFNVLNIFEFCLYLHYFTQLLISNIQVHNIENLNAF